MPLFALETSGGENSAVIFRDMQKMSLSVVYTDLPNILIVQI